MCEPSGARLGVPGLYYTRAQGWVPDTGRVPPWGWLWGRTRPVHQPAFAHRNPAPGPVTLFVPRAPPYPPVRSVPVPMETRRRCRSGSAARGFGQWGEPGLLREVSRYLSPAAGPPIAPRGPGSSFSAIALSVSGAGAAAAPHPPRPGAIRPPRPSRPRRRGRRAPPHPPGPV